jgi:hypothetical protein
MRLLAIALAMLSEQTATGLPTPQGTRLLHAEERGYAVDAYAVQGAPAEALAAYERRLTGLRVHTIQGALAVRGRETAIVHAYREGNRTVLALVKLGDEEHDQ